VVHDATTQVLTVSPHRQMPKLPLPSEPGGGWGQSASAKQP
jgi:hypothetical protein